MRKWSAVAPKPSRCRIAYNRRTRQSSKEIREAVTDRGSGIRSRGGRPPTRGVPRRPRWDQIMPTANTRPRAGRREWVGLAALGLPVFLVSMDFSVLYLGVPYLTADLAPSGIQQLWIVDIYGFLIAGPCLGSIDAHRNTVLVSGNMARLLVDVDNALSRTMPGADQRGLARLQLLAARCRDDDDETLHFPGD